ILAFMRFLACSFFICFSFLSSSQKSSSDYYNIFKLIESRDTVGLFTKIYTKENADHPVIYSSLAKGDYSLGRGDLKEALDNYTAALTMLKPADPDSTRALVYAKVAMFHYWSNNYTEALKYFNKASLVYN